MAGRWTIPGAVVLAAAVSTFAIGSATGGHKPPTAPAGATWTTVLKTTLGIEGLTGDDDGNLYVAARSGGAACPVYRVDADGPANQTPAVVGSLAPPCSPAGLAFGPDGRLYVTGFNAANDQLGVLTPNEAAPPVATLFATGVPGANGIAFDADGDLYVSDGGTAQGRVFRVGPAGGAATELFRVPPMLNSVGVGAQRLALPTGTAQNIVANGLAFDKHGTLLVADTARGALWRVELAKDGSLETAVGCDTTFTANTLCWDALWVEHVVLEGADGIALDRAGNVWVDPNERNAIGVVDDHGRVAEYFRNPVAAGNLRNAGPLEFPTSPFLADRTLCTTSSDGGRRDNAPNSAGEVGGATGFAGKISCLDVPLHDRGLELPDR
jgi:sugar lactone lactonase YvrE